jgi:HK97 family phage major capsid protein
MSPRYKPAPLRSSFAEYRSARSLSTQLGSGSFTGADEPIFSDSDGVFWKWLLAKPLVGADSRIQLTKPERRVLSKASASAGGNLVPTDFEAQIVQVLRTRSVIARLARVLPTDSGTSMLMPTTTAHGTATWTAENTSYTLSDETFGQVSIGAFKASAAVIASEELAQDAGIEFDQYLAEELGARMGSLVDTAYVAGSGTGQPLGVSTSGNGISVVTAATGSSTSYKLADLVAVYKALPAAYRSRATWLIHPDDFASLAGLADTAGGLVFQSLQADPPTLLGRPVELSPDLAAPAANARSLVFGDFETAYTVRLVRGIGVQRQEELYSANGQIGYRGYLRTDGRVVVADAARILAHSAT